MEKEIRLSYTEYKEIVDENENMKSELKKKEHKLIIEEITFIEYSGRLYNLPSINTRKTEYRGPNKKIESKIMEYIGKNSDLEIEIKRLNSINESLAERINKLNSVKNKWWFKLFGGKYRYLI